MASLHREVPFPESPDELWARIENPAEIGKWFTFLGEVTYDEATSSRQCDLGEGRLDELIVDIDPARRRFVYAFLQSPFGFTQHSAAMHVLEGEEGGSVLSWTHDFKPDEAAPAIERTLDEVIGAITSA